MTPFFFIRSLFLKYDVSGDCRGSDHKAICFCDVGPKIFQKNIVVNFYHPVCYGQPFWYCTKTLDNKQLYEALRKYTHLSNNAITK